MTDLKTGFQMRKIRLSLAVIVPVRQVKDPEETVHRYKPIRASIKEVGLVEPLLVHPHRRGDGTYRLLDGHLRLCVLKELGQTEADCVIANNNENFTL